MTVTPLAKLSRIQQTVILALQSASRRAFTAAPPDSVAAGTTTENPNAEGASLAGGCVVVVHPFTKKEAAK